MKMFRQGDVLLLEVCELPSGIKSKDKILAYGEVTGHKHQFRNNQALVFADKIGNQFLDIKQESILEHEEHKNISIPKGKYRVVLQREFDLLQGVRQVLD